MRMILIAFFALVIPGTAFAQQPAANDNVEKPAEPVTPPTIASDGQAQTPPSDTQVTPPAEALPTTADGADAKKDEHDGKSCEGGRGHGFGGWGANRKWDGGEHSWGEVRPWRVALEAGGAFGLGLNAQLTFKSRSGFAIGVGAIGFGQNALEDRFGRRDRDDGSRGDADIRQGYYLSLARYRQGWGRGGFFAGARLGAAETVLTSTDGSVDRLWAGFITPELGYQWFPFQRAFFVRPAVGASLVVARWGGTAGAPVPPFVVPSATLTLGFAL